MQTASLATTRHPKTSVEELRRAQGTLKPFLGGLADWNGKVAQFRERAASPYSNEEERRLARLEAGALLAEVRRRHSEFRSAIKGEPAHGRIADVDAAFERLIEQLRSVWTGR